MQARNSTIKKVERLDILNLLLSIPQGKVSTYKDIATILGRSKASRSIGKILNKNPFPIIIPCHRIVKSDGSIGGYVLGIEFKERLLKNEGITIINGIINDFEKVKIDLNDLLIT
jgi:methylated-DNA-[protein]-cysteine S-methyltransferase